MTGRLIGAENIRKIFFADISPFWSYGMFYVDISLLCDHFVSPHAEKLVEEFVL
jgi:hypothetical protein